MLRHDNKTIKGLYTPFVYSTKKVMEDTGVNEASANIILSVLGACNTVSRWVGCG